MRKFYPLFFCSLLVFNLNCSEDESSEELPINPDPSDITFSEEDLSNTTAELNWKVVTPTEANTIVVYDIFLDGNEIRKGNTDTDFVLTKLTANTPYKGEIIARSTDKGNEGGRSHDETLKTIVFSFETPDYITPNAPEPSDFNVSNESLEATSTILNWEPATISDNSTVTYTVYLEGNVVVKGTTETSLQLTQLTESTTYTGEVMALSSNEKTTFKSFTFQTPKSQVPVTEIKILPEQLTLRKLLSRQLVATVLPENATEKGVIWTSGDEAILTIDAEGNVEVLSEEEATTTITATSVENNAISSSIAVTIKSRLGKIISVGPEKMHMAIGDTRELFVTTLNGNDPTFLWESGNTDIATVSANGTVTAVATGIVPITVTAADDPSLVSTSIITVVADPIAATNVELFHFLELNKLYPGEIVGAFRTRITPEIATDQRITWTSSDPTVVEILSNNSLRGTTLVKTLKEGTATITATSVQNTQLSDEIILTVLESPVSFDPTTGLYKAPPGSVVETFGQLSIESLHPSSVTISFEAYTESNQMGTTLINSQDEIIFTEAEFGDVQSFPFPYYKFTMPESGEVYLEGKFLDGFGSAFPIIQNSEGPTISALFTDLIPIPENN